jgi:alpha-tubulin suppressor-like RCC1 family protein/regulation of enolase protein 1 (concanavalin A-like superfamily)
VAIKSSTRTDEVSGAARSVGFLYSLNPNQYRQDKMSQTLLCIRRLLYLLVTVVGTFSASAQDGWFYNDVGTVGTAGTSVFNVGTGTFTVTSSGSDIGGDVDSFGFNYRIMAGDGAIIARLASVPVTDPAAEAGLMIRNDLTSRSINAALLVSGGNQVAFQHRAAAGGTSQVSGATTITLPIWLKLVRTGSTVTGYRSADGIAWTQVGSATVSFGSSVFVGMGVASHVTATGNATFDNVSAPWRNQDIGTVGLAGNSTFNGVTNTYTVAGAGADISGGADAFNFVYRPLSGDGQIIARVASVQNTNASAKAGVMIRETLTAGSRMALMSVTPSSGALYVYRTSTGGNSKSVTATGVTAPVWVKLVRTGSTVIGYRSSDGVSWTQVSSQTISMATDVFVGLAVTSRTTAALCSAAFENVSLIRRWQDQDLGATGLAGRTEFSEFDGKYTVYGAGLDIAGTSDSFHYLYRAQNGDAQIVARVVTQSNPTSTAKFGIMMRSAVTATAPHVSLLVTPSSGLLFQRRSTDAGTTTTTTVAGIVAPVWLKLIRSGDVFSAYRSTDGITWTSVGSQTITMPASTFVGMCETSGSTSALGSVTISDVEAGGVDTDNDSLPDAWENQYFGGLTQTRTGDFDGDGITNIREYTGNSGPADFFNGVTPVITITGGNNQTGMPDTFASQALAVQLAYPSGTTIPLAPVTFTVTQGGGGLATTLGGATAATRDVTANASGQASIYFKQPSTYSTTSTITATAKGNPTSPTATFTETTLIQTAPPVCEPPPGYFATRQTVTVTCATPGAKIYYTSLTRDPLETDPWLTSGQTLTIADTTTLRLKAVVPGNVDSAVNIAKYHITGAVVAGYQGCFALKTDGTVYSWGKNTFGELGQGNTQPVLFPQQITGLTDIVAVAAGYNHAVALTRNGDLLSWGLNNNGQLGINSTQPKTTPTAITALTGVKAIACGAYHTVALKSDGTVWAWGLNSDGQLGDNSTQNRLFPVQVKGLSGSGFLNSIKAIAAGEGHSMALKQTDGAVLCWGRGTSGQLGNNDTANKRVPVQTTFTTAVTRIAAGGNSSMAIDTNTVVWCWGLDDEGQLGDDRIQNGGTIIGPTFQSVPVNPIYRDFFLGMVPVQGVDEVSMGYDHALALAKLMPNPLGWGWGNNVHGELARWNYFDDPTAEHASDRAEWCKISNGSFSNMIQMAAGYRFSLELVRDGTIWFSGVNSSGQHGNGTIDTLDHETGEQVPTLNLLRIAAAPVFTPPMGYYPGTTVSVTATCAEQEAIIRYTLDGTEPTVNSPIAENGTISVPIPSTLKAKAWKEGLQVSTVATARYESNLDTDGDGLPDALEISIGTDPTRKDTDLDGMSDGFEVAYGLNPRLNDGSGDLDNDGVINQEDARPNNPAVGRLNITITYPANGSTIN